MWCNGSGIPEADKKQKGKIEMTTKKAIYQLTDLIKDRESFCHRDDFDDMFLQDIEALKIGISALEKQVPKKITAVNSPCHVKAFDSESETVYTYSCINCPVCSKWIVANVNHKYCQYCGQALDWSEEE